jgi:hypothetical protein
MSATFNPENVIQRRLDALGCPVASFAVIWGARSQSYLSQALRGNVSLGGDEARQLLQILDEMEQLAKSVEPLPVDWRSGSQIKIVLELCRARRDFAAGILALGGEQPTQQTDQA